MVPTVISLGENTSYVYKNWGAKITVINVRSDNNETLASDMIMTYDSLLWHTIQLYICGNLENKTMLS